jgi:chromosome segregation ATPase
MSNLIPWIVVGAALAAAAALYLRLRQATELASSRQIETEKLLGELKSTREQMERASTKQRRSTDEAVELRKKLEKVKRRAAGGRGAGASAGTPDQVLSLEGDLEDARQARDAAREESLALSRELSRMRAEHASQSEVGDEKPAPLLDNAAIELLQARVDELERTRGAVDAELAKANDQVERMRHKAKTQDTLYVSMRSELDAKKDRLRGQQEELERLRAMRVVVGAVEVSAPDAGATSSSAPESARESAPTSETEAASSSAPEPTPASAPVSTPESAPEPADSDDESVTPA